MKKLSVFLSVISIVALPLAAQTTAPSSGPTIAGTPPSAGAPGTINPGSPMQPVNPILAPNVPTAPISPNNPTINGVNANPTAYPPQAGRPTYTTTNMP